MDLNEHYKNLLADKHTFYYRDFNFCGNYLNDATHFLDDYFRYAGKTPLAEFNCYKPDDNERDFRNRHMVSAYLLGCIIAENLFTEEQLKIVAPNCPFNYVWYLICLFHDAGYGFERNIRERDALREISFRRERNNQCNISLRNINSFNRYVLYDFKRRQRIHSSIWFGHNKFFLTGNRNRMLLARDDMQNREENTDKEVIITRYYREHKFVKFADGMKCSFPTYNSGLINKYFEFRLLDETAGCIDHGIAGGYVFFDTMIKNYIHCYNEASKERNCDFSDFYYNYKAYKIEQFSVFGYVADCIIAHNIWNGKNNEEVYHKFGLDSLIGDDYKKISKSSNPYLFLLALSDTLEPLKIFRTINLTVEQLLRRINIEFSRSSLLISSTDKQIYNAYCWKLKGIEDWVDAYVNFNSEKNEIKISF